MEPVGLAVGVAGLLVACGKLIEQFDDYRDYESATWTANQRREALGIKLKKWKNEAGFIDAKTVGPHCPFLHDEEALNLIKAILENIAATLEEVDQSIAKHSRTKLKTIAVKIKWATRSKQITGRRIDIVEGLIEILCSTFPPKSPQDVAVHLETDLSLLVEERLHEIRKRNEDKVKEWLGVRHFVQDYADFAAKRTVGTCEWIWDHNEYKTWSLNDSPDCQSMRLLWIHGPPGYGKSVLTGLVLAKLSSHSQYPIAYCFSRLHMAASGSLSDVPRLWIAQILKHKPEAIDLAINSVDTSKLPMATDSDAWSLLRDICMSTKPCVLALDGLDEYHPQTGRTGAFVATTVQYLSGVGTCVLISSRSEVDIQESFDAIQTSKADLSLHRCLLNREVTSSDIRKCVENLVSTKLHGWTQKWTGKITEVLIEKSDGMFLWIQLWQDLLDPETPPKQLIKRLEALPKDLVATYEQYWLRIIQEEHEYVKHRALAMLAWILFAVRPLTVAELVEALCVSQAVIDDDNDEDLICPENLPQTITKSYVNKHLRGPCGSMIELRPGHIDGIAYQTVHFLHASARDFVLNRILTQEFERGGDGKNMSYGPGLLAESCIAYLQQDCGWRRDCDGWETESWMARPALLNYAAESWFQHAKSAEMEKGFSHQVIAKFMDESCTGFTRWASFQSRTLAKYPASVRNQLLGGTPLYYASLHSLHSVIKSLYDLHPENLNNARAEFGTPLQAACTSGDAGMVNTLCQMGASIHAVGGIYGTPLNAAASLGHEKCIQALIKNIRQNRQAEQKRYGRAEEMSCKNRSMKPEDSINMKALTFFKRQTVFAEVKFRHFTPLHCAAWNQQAKVAQILIDEGADVNIGDQNGYRPLILAAEKGDLEMVTLLLSAKADVFASTDKQTDSLTATNAAARFGQSMILAKLMEAGAVLDAVNDRGWRPLDYAAFRNKTGALKLLLEHGAPLNIWEDGIDQALWHASYGGCPEAVEMLLAHGARSYTPDSVTYASAIHSASRYGEVDVIKVLLQNGTPIDIQRTDNGWQPLHEAASTNKLDTVQFLLDRGAVLDAKTENGSTPISIAIDSGHSRMTRLLLESGANVNICNDHGKAPIHLAYAQEDWDTTQLLLAHGAKTKFQIGDKEASLASLEDDVTTIKSSIALCSRILEEGLSDSPPVVTMNPFIIRWLVKKSWITSSPHTESIIEWLFETGAALQLVDPQDPYAIHKACQDPPDLAKIRLLVHCGQGLDIKDDSNRRPIDILSSGGSYSNLPEVEHVFRAMVSQQQQQQGSTIRIGTTGYVGAGAMFPGQWQAIYVYDTDQRVDESFFTVHPLSEHELQLAPPHSSYLAATADDIDGEFRLLGNVCAGDRNVWFNMLYPTYALILCGTLVTEARYEETEAADSVDKRIMVSLWITIEGQWGTSWEDWDGTFKLKRNFDMAELEKLLP